MSALEWHDESLGVIGWDSRLNAYILRVFLYPGRV